MADWWLLCETGWAKAEVISCVVVFFDWICHECGELWPYDSALCCLDHFKNLQNPLRKKNQQHTWCECTEAFWDMSPRFGSQWLYVIRLQKLPSKHWDFFFLGETGTLANRKLTSKCSHAPPCTPLVVAVARSFLGPFKQTGNVSGGKL